VEYILLVTAVVAVMIVFVTGSGSGGFKNQLGDALNAAAKDMSGEASTLRDSHAPGTIAVGASTDESTYTVAVNEGHEGGV